MMAGGSFEVVGAQKLEVLGEVANVGLNSVSPQHNKVV